MDKPIPFLQVGDAVEGIVEKLVFGGRGLLRLQHGIVVFVPFVVPGERICAKITCVHRSFAEGILTSIQTPSIARIRPFCPHFGVCGGCQLQHIAYEQHGAIKKGFLSEALWSLLPASVVPVWSSSNIIWAWRKKIVLHAKQKDLDISVGYFSQDNLTLISCSSCPIFFTPLEEGVLKSLREAFALLPEVDKADILLFRRPSGRIAVSFFIHRQLSAQATERLKKALFSCSFIEEGCLWNKKKKQILFSHASAVPLELKFQSISFQYSEEAFVQTHPEQPLHVWNDLYEHLTKLSSSSVLDLYSGIGVTALSAALLGHKVTAVELSNAAVRSCRATAQAHALENVTMYCSSVEDFFVKSLGKECVWHTIIINPPRQGMSKEALLYVCAQGALEIHYISCHPSTLKRDIVKLCESGYEICFVKGYDMFPQTTHFETYVRLLKKSKNKNI